MIKLNGEEVRPTIFPDKTSQVWHVDEKALDAEKFKVEWKYECEAEMAHLLQLKHLLDTHLKECTLVVEYLPYARQDKGVSNDTTFALFSFADFLNFLNFDKVIAIDVHNEHLASRLIDNFVSYVPVAQIEDAYKKSFAQLVCYPDQGALTKYKEHLSSFPFIYALKKRNPTSGIITSLNLTGACDDKRVLIVDDICDGGATFILLAQALFNRGAKEVSLYVSHGIFSKGVGVLKEAGVRQLFTKEGEIL